MSEPQGNGRRNRPPLRIDPEAAARYDRCMKDYAWFLGQPENLGRYAGRVVILRDQQILGSGRDHLEALEDARQQAAQKGASLPPAHELFAVIVPEPWYFP